MIAEDIFLRYYQISCEIESASIRDLYLVAHLLLGSFAFGFMICNMYVICIALSRKVVLFIILKLLNTVLVSLINIIYSLARDKRYSEGNSTG